VGKVLGQLAIVLVYTRTVLKTQYKTQFFKDTTHSQLYYTQKQLVIAFGIACSHFEVLRFGLV